MTSVLVNMKLSKMSAELNLLVEANVGKVLAAEDNNTSLSNQEGEFVSLFRVEGTQLQPVDLGPNGRRDYIER